MRPSACGTRSIGSRAVKRSRRRAERRAVIRCTSGNAVRSRYGSAKSAAVAVLGTDRLREPAQLAAAPAEVVGPLVVVPAMGATRQRVVIGTRARRACGAVDRDVDLVDRSPAARRGGGRAAPTSRATSPRPTTRVASSASNVGRQVEQCGGVLEVVADRDHRGASQGERVAPAGRARRDGRARPRHQGRASGVGS